MTDQNYKLVPVEPTSKMRDAGVRGLSDSGVDDAYEDDALSCYAAMVAAAPEPVCRHSPSASVDTLDGALIYATECGCTVDLLSSATYCPHCGNRVEVAGGRNE